MKLFDEAGLPPQLVQVADEKQTIINLVVARLGLAIVPRWTTRMGIPGVRFIPLKAKDGPAGRLPLAAVWLKSSRDHARDAIAAAKRGKRS